jgi:hypothetical protein
MYYINESLAKLRLSLIAKETRWDVARGPQLASNPQLPTQYLTTKPATSTDPLQHSSLSPTGLRQGPSRCNIFMTSRGTS